MHFKHINNSFKTFILFAQFIAILKATYINRFGVCDVKSYEALFTA